MNRSITLALSLLAGTAAFAGMSLEEGFKAPPRSARPHTWYHMMNGNVTKEGITRDFEALAEAGVGGVQMFDAGCAIPPGPLKFNSDEWFDLFRHAQKEAKRLGLEICIPNCSGWSSSGGPWNTPANAMKDTVFTETSAKGPARFAGVLPRTKKDNGFYEDIAVLAYPTPAPGAKISDLDKKIGKARGGNARDTKEFVRGQVVAKNSVIDLTAKTCADGRLEWDVPAGDWTILRIGYVCSGRCNHPASETGRGLEVDKLSANAMDFHFSQYVSRLCKALGISAATDNTTGFNNILVDSYEVGCQNWTQGLDATFERRMGYSLRPYLPVFAGRVVGSVDETERFLEDFRRVLADLFAENYAGRLTKLCHDNGLMCSIEPYGSSNADDLQYGQDVDIPMAEYWSCVIDDGMNFGGTGNSRFAGYLAHVWGRRYAATESFTASPGSGGRWVTTPYSIKAQGDRVYADGINRIIYHRFVHQPWAKVSYLPGMTMGRWGMHFDRTQTWWHIAPEWLRYQARCQWMLQEGRPTADVLFWCGESAPNSGKVNNTLPQGYNWDVCATKAVEMLKVKNGKIVTPGGVEYEILVLPGATAGGETAIGVVNVDNDERTMSERMVRKIGELAAAGAKVVAPVRPVRAPGLVGWPQSDARLRAAVDAAWAKGVMECSAADALKRLGVEPDFTADAEDTSWIHRKGDGSDWYFVANGSLKPVSFEASFRQSGRMPEIWDAETCEIRPAPVWREEGGRTFVRLDFRPSGSAFVVFRKPASGERHAVAVATNLDAAVKPEKRHELVIKKAVYGFFGGTDGDAAIDITRRLASKVKNGRISAQIGNILAGRDPAPFKVKSSRIDYTYDGLDRSVVMSENGIFRIPEADATASQPLPAWEWRGGELLAWRPMTARLSYSDGTSRRVAANPVLPFAVEGDWRVEFPVDWYTGGTNVKTVVWTELKDWTTDDDPDVKYFSGTATYRLSRLMSRVPADSRVLLDLGVVKDFAEVKVNGKEYPALWRPPYRIDITEAIYDGAMGPSRPDGDTLDVEIKVTNLWPNRLIGDDRLHDEDCEWIGYICKGSKEVAIKEIPQWVKDGRPSPTGRHTFTTWKHWSKEDDLLPSGLLGPVKIWFGETATEKERE